MKKIIATREDTYYYRELKKQLKAEGFTLKEIAEVISYIKAGMSEESAIQLVMDKSLQDEDPYTDTELSKVVLEEYPDFCNYLNDRMYEIADYYTDFVPSWHMKTFLVQDGHNLRGKGIEVPINDDDLSNYVDAFLDEYYPKLQDYYYQSDKYYD